MKKFPFEFATSENVETWPKIMGSKEKNISAGRNMPKKEGDLWDKQTLEWQQSYLENLRHRFYSEIDRTFTIFLSYTNTGLGIKDEFIRAAGERGVTIVTYNAVYHPTSNAREDLRIAYFGDFEARESLALSKQGSALNYLPDKIQYRIANCSAFVGIWSPNFEVKEMDAEDERESHSRGEAGPRPAPGAWMPYEYGIAFGLRKPYRIIFQKKLHHAYIDRLLGGKMAIAYEERDLRSKPSAIAQALSELMEEAKINRRPK